MKSDIQIAQAADILPIKKIAQGLQIDENDLIPYGKTKAKIDLNLIKRLNKKPDGKLILVTAISPTPAGEGKTTTSVGLADAMHRLEKNVVLALREPSLGPVFGVKGGAAGGGYAQVVPMEDINLHFTGDLHAIGAANNLLAAMVDNHIFHGNELGLDVRRVTWRRCVDMNDRQLRFVTDGLGGKANGTPREDGFDITVASEIMAIFCLAQSLTDLKQRISRIVVGYTFGGKPVTAGDIGAQGAMVALLKDALNPNLVQTLEHTPAIIHGGPFANIAHGCNSVIATKMALKLGDYVVTEAGFGADLGAEKFLDIKCRMSKLSPAAVVVVATIRALKHHGGCPKADLGKENLELLQKGSANLVQHVENMREKYGMAACVAINAFPTDTKAEHDYLRKLCAQLGVKCALSEVFAKGGEGGIEMAQAVLDILESREIKHPYANGADIADAIKGVCTEIYRAQDVVFAPAAVKTLEELRANGFGNLPVCIAKTQYSFSDDMRLLAAPKGFTMTVRALRLSAGAGFVVAIMGDIMTMPGLPKAPAAQSIDVDENGVISGLF